MRSNFALAAVGAALLLGVFGGAARAALPVPVPGPVMTPPVPANAIALPDNGTVGTTVVLSDGTIEPVTITTSTTETSRAQVSALGATALDATALTCWTAKNEIEYGPSWAIIMTYAQTIGWCGNGSKISGTPGQQIAAKVTVTGQATFWQFAGVIDKEMTQYYAGWAYQAYTEGHFHQCPIIQFACFDDKYPQLWMNVYANGNRQKYWSP